MAPRFVQRLKTVVRRCILKSVQGDESKEVPFATHFGLVLGGLYADLSDLNSSLRLCGKPTQHSSLQERVYLQVRSVFFAQTSEDLRHYLSRYFDSEFDECQSQSQDSESGHSTAGFRVACEQLDVMGWLDRCESVYSDVIYKRIHQKLLQDCKGQYEQSVLDEMLSWVLVMGSGWLQIILQSQKHTKHTPLGQWRTRLRQYVYDNFAELRISEMWDIIVSYPDSTPVCMHVLCVLIYPPPPPSPLPCPYSWSNRVLTSAHSPLPALALPSLRCTVHYVLWSGRYGYVGSH